MSAKFNILLGAILGTCLVAVAAGAVSSWGSPEAKAIQKLNKFLVDATGPGVTNWAANVVQAAAKDIAGYGLWESSLKTAIGKLMKLGESSSCTLDVVEALAYFSFDEASKTRVNMTISEGFWTDEMRTECANSLADVAKELNSKFPEDDDRMQTFLKHVKHHPADQLIHHPYGPKIENLTPVSPNFADAYFYKPNVIGELISIAREKKIALVTNKHNELTGHIERKIHKKQYNELVKNYFTYPCKIQLKLGSNFNKFIRFWLNKSNSGSLSRNEKFNNLPEEVRNIYYRTEACRLFKQFKKQ